MKLCLVLALGARVLAGCASDTKSHPSQEIVPPSIEDPAAAAAPEDAGSDASDDSPQQGVIQAVDAIRAKDFEKAKSILSAARKNDPKDPRVAYYLGVALQNTGDAKAAKDEYRAALALEPGLSEASVGLSSVLLSENDSAGALESAESGLKANPQNPELLLSRAQALDAAGKKDDAIRAYGDVVQARPEDPALRMTFADRLSRAGEGKRALEQLRSAASTDDVAALLLLSERFANVKAFADCVAALDKAVKLKPGPDVLIRRGQCRRAQRDNAGALADYEAAVKLDEKYSPAHLELGKQLCAKDKKRALAEFDLALQYADAEAGKKAKQARDDCAAGRK
ncbi:MAG TPA: tetratricopeptide repeat protein [Polyangiaceae bacterium]|nr:tetratricopeptide repeat protein [Polyangiaceae bacterium]